MASVRKTKAGRFKVQWREGGRGTPQRSKTFDTETEAEIYKREVESAQLRGEQPAESAGEDAPSLIEIHTEYVRRVAHLYRVSTLRHMCQNLDMWERWLLENFGPSPSPQVLTRRNLEDYAVYLSNSGAYKKGRKQSTVNLMVGAVIRMWRWAYDDEVYDRWTPKPRDITLKKAPRAQAKAPTWAQMDAVIELTPPSRRVLPVLLRFTGLRVGQVMRLRWADFDMPSASLTVRGELGKTNAERSGRIIPISSHLVREMSDWVREGEYVVPFNDRQDNVNRWARPMKMNRAWELAQVPPPFWQKRPHHAFRKGFCSGLKRLGADSEAVEFLVGHTQGIRDHYVDPDSLGLRDTVEMIPKMASLAELRGPEGGGVFPWVFPQNSDAQKKA